MAYEIHLSAFPTLNLSPSHLPYYKMRGYSNPPVYKIPWVYVRGAISLPPLYYKMTAPSNPPPPENTPSQTGRFHHPRPQDRWISDPPLTPPFTVDFTDTGTQNPENQRGGSFHRSPSNHARTTQPPTLWYPIKYIGLLISTTTLSYKPY
jgi:hypothetical protein